MKRFLFVLIALILLLSSCTSTHNDGVSDWERKNIYTDKNIFVLINVDNVELDYSVYTPEYFGDAYSDCKIYDLYVTYGLTLILKLKPGEEKNVKEHIAEFYQRGDVRYAATYRDVYERPELEEYGKMYYSYLTEYSPEKSPVKLVSRRMPYGPHYADYKYDRNYRMLYYKIDNVFCELVSPKQWYEWREYFDKFNGFDAYCSLSAEPKEMALVSFIKYFNIPKADFEAKILEYKNSVETKHKDSFRLHTEYYEIPNADIIYTFDNNVINEYYRYE